MKSKANNPNLPKNESEDRVGNPPDSGSDVTSSDRRRLEQKNRTEVRELWRLTSRYSFIGIEFAVGIGGGYWLGHYLDTRWETNPWMTVTLVLLGTAAATKDLIHLVKKALREEM